MVYQIITTQVAPGMSAEAIEWGEKRQQWMKDKFAVETTRMVPITPGPGQAGRQVAILTYDSLASWSDVTQKVFDAPEHQEFLKTWREVYVPSAFTRTIYRTI